MCPGRGICQEENIRNVTRSLPNFIQCCGELHGGLELVRALSCPDTSNRQVFFKKKNCRRVESDTFPTF